MPFTSAGTNVTGIKSIELARIILKDHFIEFSKKHYDKIMLKPGRLNRN